MKKLLTVLKFEYMTFIKSTAFLVMLGIMVLMGVAIQAVPALLQNLSGQEEEKGGKVAILDNAGRFTQEVCAQYLPEYSFEFFQDVDAVKEAVLKEDCAFGVEVIDNAFVLYVPSMKISVYGTSDRISTMLRSEYRTGKLRAAGLSDAEMNDIINFTPASRIVSVDASGDKDSSSDFQENLIYAYVMLFMLYMGLLMTGQYILTSVVREKTTKTMELLITSCKPGALINGKVLGVGLVGLTQLAVVAAVTLISMRLFGQSPADALAGEAVAASTLSLTFKPYLVAYMSAFYMLGFFLYAYLYAALGSTVSRMEDAGSVSTVPMMLIVIGFISSIIGMTRPGELWVKVLSYVPFTSPMAMFMRVCMGSAAAWEAMLSIAIQFASILLVAWLGARVYRMGTLLYGNRLKLKDMVLLFR